MNDPLEEIMWKLFQEKIQISIGSQGMDGIQGISASCCHSTTDIESEQSCPTQLKYKDEIIESSKKSQTFRPPMDQIIHLSSDEFFEDTLHKGQGYFSVEIVSDTRSTRDFNILGGKDLAGWVIHWDWFRKRWTYGNSASQPNYQLNRDTGILCEMRNELAEQLRGGSGVDGISYYCKHDTNHTNKNTGKMDLRDLQHFGHDFHPIRNQMKPIIQRWIENIDQIQDHLHKPNSILSTYLLQPLIRVIADYCHFLVRGGMGMMGENGNPCICK